MLTVSRTVGARGVNTIEPKNLEALLSKQFDGEAIEACNLHDEPLISEHRFRSRPSARSLCASDV